MVRPSPGTAEVRMVQLQVMHPSPTATKPVMLDEGTQTDIGLDGSLEGMVSELSVIHGSAAEGGSVVDSTDATHSEEMASEVDSDGNEFYDAVLLDDYGVALDAVPEGDDDDDVSDLPSGAMPSTSLRRLEMEYARCMKVNADELDLEPAVYIHEGSELLSQLRDQLAMLPELRDLSPQCDIDTADVGVPGVSTLDEDRKLRSILRYHRTLFLEDGNAAPAPARGVVAVSLDRRGRVPQAGEGGRAEQITERIEKLERRACCCVKREIHD
jgi:hypothetical protein